MISIKKKMTKIIQEQPEDSTYDEIMKELAFEQMIIRGLSDSHKAKTITDAQMKRKIRLWQK